MLARFVIEYNPATEAFRVLFVERATTWNPISFIWSPDKDVMAEELQRAILQQGVRVAAAA